MDSIEVSRHLQQRLSNLVLHAFETTGHEKKLISFGMLAVMAATRQDERGGHAIIEALVAVGADNAPGQLQSVVRKVQKKDQTTWTKSDLLGVLDSGYREDPNYDWLRAVLRKTPIRSLSGITSITVLTKPFPCPGKCVFCPVDVRMPKSYIATEPGALRAGRLGFDPYQQVASRLKAYADMGHPVAKIEFIVLGGTWSAYPRDYQLWFIKRMFEALNDFGVKEADESHAYAMDWDDHIATGETYDAHINKSQYVKDPYAEVATQDELDVEHKRNENAVARCVGLSLETRPDLMDRQEAINLRSLGATKIQIGIQSLDDRVLRLNKRGHSVAKTEKALRLLRQFGFKIHVHWMPNLYGSNPEADIIDYAKVFSNPAIRPDELKVYPTALIQDTELEQIAAKGLWQPYSEESLRDVLGYVLTHTPEYARLTRIIRDIPSNEILAGNKKGNFRQIVEGGIEANAMVDIRAREIKGEIVPATDLVMEATTYETADTDEEFLQFVRPGDRKIAAFLRLSFPRDDADLEPSLPELAGAAIIREVHVYGQSIALDSVQNGSQHQGLGRQLVAEAKHRATERGFSNLVVISAIGTRQYYEKLGFEPQGLYHRCSL